MSCWWSYFRTFLAQDLSEQEDGQLTLPNVWDAPYLVPPPPPTAALRSFSSLSSRHVDIMKKNLAPWLLQLCHSACCSSKMITKNQALNKTFVARMVRVVQHAHRPDDGSVVDYKRPMQ